MQKEKEGQAYVSLLRARIESKNLLAAPDMMLNSIEFPVVISLVVRLKIHVTTQTFTNLMTESKRAN